MTPSNKLLIPVGILAVSFFGVAHFMDKPVYGWLAVVFIIIGAIIYIFSPQIDWKYYNKKPPQMPVGLHRFFDDRIQFYQRMHPFYRKIFRERVMLFIEATDFKAQVTDEFPNDLKAIIAANAVLLTMNKKDFLFPRFEHVILYPHPFPSPQMLDHWHASEINEEDGVILYAAEQLMKGFTQPTKYYNVGLHEYIKVYQLTYPDYDYPIITEQHWESLKSISRFSKDILLKWMGLPELDPQVVAINHFFMFPERFKKELPAEYQQLSQIFH